MGVCATPGMARSGRGLDGRRTMRVGVAWEACSVHTAMTCRWIESEGEKEGEKGRGRGRMGERENDRGRKAGYRC